MSTLSKDVIVGVDSGGSKPGWPEIAIGLAVLSILGIGGALALVRVGIDASMLGLILSALSGVAGMAGFIAAFSLRIRTWHSFGVRTTTWRWLGVGALAGIGTFFVKSLSILAYVAITGDDRTPQEIYAAGASNGGWTLVATTFCLSVVTPIGEEFLFRGVVTSALLRHGALIGVFGGAIVFAVFHGVNMVFPAALVTGLVAGEVFRRSRSIWPSIMVHVAVNLPTIPVMVLVGRTT